MRRRIFTGGRFGAIDLADIAVASFFRNAAYGDFSVDSRRWGAADRPKLGEKRPRPGLMRL